MTVPGWLSQTLEDSQFPLRPVRVEPAGAERSADVVPAVVRPFSAEELEAAWVDWSAYSPVLADVMLVLARTGLRWGEARALTVGDADAELLTVDKSAGEDGRVRSFLPTRVREVPVAARIRPIVERLVAGRDDEELLLTTSLGEPLHRTAVLRRLDWPRTGRGRRLHDLRQTAAHLWLAEGADPADVRCWLG